MDSSGNAYIAGATASTNFPTMNPIQGANAGYYDAWVAKLNATGSALVYSTYLGGSSTDQAFKIAVDSSGDACITGTTNSTNFPTMNPIQGALVATTFLWPNRIQQAVRSYIPLIWGQR